MRPWEKRGTNYGSDSPLQTIDHKFLLPSGGSDFSPVATGRQCEGREEKYRLNWRSFWNGPKGPFGPISQDWKIPTWPYNFVLDADGVVRHRNVGGQKLEQAIETLIAEAKRG